MKNTMYGGIEADKPGKIPITADLLIEIGFKEKKGDGPVRVFELKHTWMRLHHGKWEIGREGSNITYECNSLARLVGTIEKTAYEIGYHEKRTRVHNAFQEFLKEIGR